jgi:hypothetical protein
MNRPELTYEEFCAMPLQYTQGIRMNDSAVRQYGNVGLGFYKEVVTPYDERTGEWGTPTTVFYLPDDERTFDTPDQLYVAYMEKACGMEAAHGAEH